MKKETASEVGAAGAGVGLGAVIGSGIGVAGIFGAAPATVPLAILAGGICWGYAKYKNVRKENIRLKAQVAQDIRDAAP